MRTSSGEVLIQLDRTRQRGLRVQVEDGLRDAIRSGRLSPGTLLPSTRAVAADLGVTRGVIVAAYDQLVAEGYLVSQPGSGTLVNEAADRQPPQRGERPGDAAVLIDFHPGLPDVGLFPRPAWLRATRRALQRMPESDLGYVDPRGLLPLRDALAGYLGRVRGVSATPDQVLVCNGFAHGLGLVVQALVDSGLDLVAVEHPGHEGPATRSTGSASGTAALRSMTMALSWSSCGDQVRASSSSLPRTSARPARCSHRRGAPRSRGGPATSTATSSKTTTTPSTATTAIRSARSKAWPPIE
jgi:GntR family transcriptional regulator/MocR family aminotransferase